jgi:glutamate dehydrogenase (NADP+)
MSDSAGYDADGIDAKLAFVMELKMKENQYVEKYQTKYFDGTRPWEVKCDIIALCNSK